MIPERFLPADAEGEDTGLTVVDLVKRVQAGTITGKALHPEDRREVVKYLLREQRLTNLEMATLLKVSEKTMERDHQKIRAENALPRCRQFIYQTAGHIWQEAQNRIANIDREMRTASPDGRIAGNKASFDILIKAVKTLQSMGWLPKRESDSYGVTIVEAADARYVQRNAPAWETHEAGKAPPATDPSPASPGQGGPAGTGPV